MILILHHRYRIPGGEERAVEDLAWLVREHLGEDVELLTRDSARVGGRRAALGLLAGGLAPDDVAAAVRRSGARVVHAHNVQPTFGWRALAAARGAGARAVLHLHNYRLVCAVGTCFTRGDDCTRCHGRNTLPGVALNCRGGSRAESATYAAGLALWQRRLAGAADAFIVPSAFALGRLRALGAPVGDRARVIPSVQRTFAPASAAASGEYALAAGRLAPEKGFADAIAGCAAAGVPLVIAGDGPERAGLERLAAEAARAPLAGRTGPAADALSAGRTGPASDALSAGRAGPAPGPLSAGRTEPASDALAAAAPTPWPVASSVRFTGRVSPAELAALRARAAVAIVPSRYEEILPLAALEAMAAGLPVVAARAGGLAETVPEPGLYPPGDVAALADRVRRLWRDAGAGEAALARVRERCAPPVVAAQLAAVYAGS